jgi:DnaJ like chaperone protein
VPDPQEKSWHEVLEVAPDADLDAIHSAHQRLISLYHPDKVASLGRELQELATSKAQAINAAYQRALEARKAAS